MCCGTSTDQAVAAGPGRRLWHPADHVRGDPEPNLAAVRGELGTEPEGAPVGFQVGVARRQCSRAAGPVRARPCDDDLLLPGPRDPQAARPPAVVFHGFDAAEQHPRAAPLPPAGRRCGSSPPSGHRGEIAPPHRGSPRKRTGGLTSGRRRPCARTTAGAGDPHSGQPAGLPRERAGRFSTSTRVYRRP